MKHTFSIPLSVPKQWRDEYCKNMSAITKDTDKTFIFACDQKIEHLHSDFMGNNIAPEVAHPQHLFEIASKGIIGAMAVPFGLLVRYAHQYNNINYIAKLSGKTNLIPATQQDPFSGKLWSIGDVIRAKKEYNIPIVGVGCTLYIGSQHEASMLEFTADMIQQAHQNGLIAILWIYPRGRAVLNSTDPELLAGVAGLANVLGADIVKIQPSKNIDDLPMAIAAAGNTKVICAGGTKMESDQFIQMIKAQMSVEGIGGVAVGRNIFQLPKQEAIEMTQQISRLVYK